jgi:tRNA uracil 4-sulfurtransferase
MQDAQHLLIRLSSEVTTKARGTRKRFQRRLAANMRDALESTGEPFEVDSEWNRIFVRARSPEAAEVLRRVPGISSLSPIEGDCPATLADIVETGRSLFGDRVRGHTYAVRARRSGGHPFSSDDIHKQLGAALNPGAIVDLGNPEVVVEVEVRDDRAYLFSRRLPGMGGLPLGVEGRAVCLLSGGFDSAVAAWLLLKRGVALDYVFCNLAGAANERSVIQVAKILSDQWSYGTRPRLYALDYEAPLAALRAERGPDPRFWQLLLKRLMYRSAERIAEEIGAAAIITGESIGQVSSQTLANLAVIERSVETPVLRPLIGLDKTEIIDISRVIGTYGHSASVQEHCAISPAKPVTAARLNATEREEAKVDLSSLETADGGRKELDLRALGTADLVEPYLFTEEVPEGATVIDLQPESEDAWRYPGAEHRQIWDLLGSFRRLQKDRPYLLYCGHGLQAAQVAERMQSEGFEAYAFRGGTRGLRRLVEEAEPVEPEAALRS